MDTDRTRELARMERMEQELALLRKVEQALVELHFMFPPPRTRRQKAAVDNSYSALQALIVWREGKVTP